MSAAPTNTSGSYWPQCLSCLRNGSDELPNDFARVFEQQLSAYVDRINGRNKAAPWKQLVLDTRTALRSAMSALGDEKHRSERQSLLSKSMDHLGRILSAPEGDARCRTLSARLLCNLVTSHPFNAKQASLIVIVSLISVEEHLRNESTELDFSWLDMIVSSASDRKALAAVVAALYNTMHSMDGCRDWCRQVARASLFVAALLRHVIPVTAMQAHADYGDEATQWITLVLQKLIDLGHLADMYTAIGSSLDRVVPEQMVLLSVARQALGESRRELTETKPSALFLVHLFDQLQVTTEANVDWPLEQKARPVVLDAMSEILSDNDAWTAHLRQTIGETTNFISNVGNELGRILDDLVRRNSGKKARDMAMAEDEQLFMTSVVRVLGNLCHGCHYNQDLLRTTLLPTVQAPHRTLLHVLLSCTSFSTVCFTLREWAVVAIRHALDGNAGNRLLVAELEAQQAVQSAALTDMGLRVDLDPNGKIHVAPLNPAQEED